MSERRSDRRDSQGDPSLGSGGKPRTSRRAHSLVIPNVDYPRPDGSWPSENMPVNGGGAAHPRGRAILARERDRSLGTPASSSARPGAPDVDALRDASANGSPQHRAQCRLVAPPTLPHGTPTRTSTCGSSTWSRPTSRDRSRGRPASGRRFCSRAADRARPLWRIDAVPMEDGGGALVWRIHHALADGSAAMRTRERAVGRGGEAAGGAPRRRPRRGRPQPAPPTAPTGRAAAHTAPASARASRPRAGHRSPLDGQSASTARSPSRRSARRGSSGAKALGEGATLNDVVLAAVAADCGAGWRASTLPPAAAGEGAGQPPPRGRRGRQPRLVLRCRVSARRGRPGRAAARGHQGRSRARRTTTPRRSTRCCTSSRPCPPRLERFAERVERSPRMFALNVSNVPGPREPVAVLGARVESMHSLAEIGERHALRVAVVSLGGHALLRLLRRSHDRARPADDRRGDGGGGRGFDRRGPLSPKALRRCRPRSRFRHRSRPRPPSPATRTAWSRRRSGRRGSSCRTAAACGCRSCTGRRRTSRPPS